MVNYKSVVFDTETSKMFDFKQPADAPGQGRLASIAMLFLDENLLIERQVYKLIRPDGWEIDPEAAAVNGLTTEELARDGVDVIEALHEYSGAVNEGRVMVAFNAAFDTKVMRGELRRAGVEDLYGKTRDLCLMRAMRGKVPGLGSKWPKLNEAYIGLFGIQPDGAHTAIGDAISALYIMRKLDEMEMLPEPKTHVGKPS